MPTPAVVVFTAKTKEMILAEGGTSAWRLHPEHAKARTYAVCTRNTFAKWSKGPEEHRSAFLVGKIRNVVPALHRDERRYLIEFSEYAEVKVPKVWAKGDRNPVKYVDIEDLGIDPAKLKWKPMPTPQAGTVPPYEPSAPADATPLTIAEAKKRLAATFGVSVDAVEITIRA
jgi:hypothetical protein